jgi:hypothetical protein
MGLLEGVLQKTAGWPDPLPESVMLLNSNCEPVKVSWLAVEELLWSHTSTHALQVLVELCMMVTDVLRARLGAADALAAPSVKCMGRMFWEGVVLVSTTLQ